MICVHHFVQSGLPDYNRCRDCGTYKARVVPDQFAYWGGAHSTPWEQCWNVDMHTENGVSKNRFVIDRIESERFCALDIGCAPGRLLYWLKHAARFKVVVGVEPDERIHEAVRQIGCFNGHLLGGFFPKVTRWETVATGGTPMFDYISALDVLEHSNEPEAFLAECFRLMTPGGQLFLMLPLADKTPENSRFFNASEHVYLHTFHHMRVMLEHAGFQGTRHDCWAVGHDTVSARKA